jgi:adenosylcobinamide kinase/adenosylcobinamide-phosphate guanylyltransferase
VFTLVTGGAASGKSAYAERLILGAGDMPRYYIATMQPFDAECRARIEKHRRMRAKKRFETVECYTSLQTVRLPERGAVLLECLGNLAANELFSPEGAGDDALSALTQGVEALLPQCETLVVVSNEVFSGGSRYEGDTLHWVRLLAEAGRALAARADNVCEVVCGIPVYYKGKEPVR